MSSAADHVVLSESGCDLWQDVVWRGRIAQGWRFEKLQGRQGEEIIALARL